MLSGWYVHSTVAYKDVPDSLKMYRGKDCENFIEHIEDAVLKSLALRTER